VFTLDSPDSGRVAVDNDKPYGFALDTRTLTNGLHTLYVRAEDNALNVESDATVTFNVQN